MKVAICLMFKDEHKHLPDFINYHRSLGVDDIIIYDNNSNPPVPDNIPNTIVKRWPDDGPAKQQRAYADCLATIAKQYDWVGFIDTDEFVVLKKHSNIKDLLKDYNDHGALGISWLCFGSSRLDSFSSHSEFYMHSEPSDEINTHIKSFVKTSAVQSSRVYPEIMVNNQYILKNMPVINGNYVLGDPHYFGVETVDPKFNKVTGPFNRHDRDICYIKHCLVRTKAEVEEKKVRGRGDGAGKNPLYYDWDNLEKTFNASTEEKIVWSFR
jgi:hypothetical protein